jgi:hypothetical protein
VLIISIEGDSVPSSQAAEGPFNSRPTAQGRGNEANVRIY